MNEQINTLAGGEHNRRPHFLWPSWGKVFLTLTLGLAMAVVVYATTAIVPGQCSMWGVVCFGPGVYAIIFLLGSAEFLGGWPWGYLSVFMLILASMYCLGCLLLKLTDDASAPA